MNSDNDPIKSYKVLINDEEQYSLWPGQKEVPRGWREVGVSGSKKDCLDHIEKVWTDITPLSVRKRLEQERTAAPPAD